MDNQIKGKGIKYYQNGSKKIEGIFDTLNLCKGIYYAPDNKELYKGKIKNEIPIISNDVVLYNDNTLKIYEGEMINGTYEGYGIEYYPLVKDMVMYKGYFSNNNFILHKTDDTTSKIEKKQIVTILFLSKGDQPGKSRLIANINNTEYYDCKTTGLDYTFCNFIDYRLMIYDSPTNESWIFICLNQVKRSDIVIYTIDLDNESLINESFINSIKEKKRML